MAGEGQTDFVCPNCEAPVEEDWAACPSCGLEFGPAEEEAPPAPPAAPPAAARPPAPPPARDAPPPPARSKPGKPPKAARPPKAPKPAVQGGLFARWPLVGPIARRVGTLGVLGLGLMVAGLVGYILVSNYDTMLAGRSVNTIGPNQANFVMMMALAAAAGGGLTILGLFMARGIPAAAAPMAYDEMEGTAARAEVEAGSPARTVTAEVPRAPARAPPARAPPARAAPAAAPAAAAAVDDDPFAEPIVRAEEEEEDEVGALELPTARPEPEPPARAAPPRAASESTSSSDELEDLFGELESEVQAAVAEDDVLYECPNCHGVVKEEDASCPHCQVVFEA